VLCRVLCAVVGVQVQTPLDKAEKLSEALGNDLLLKREDLQPVSSHTALHHTRTASNTGCRLPCSCSPLAPPASCLPASCVPSLPPPPCLPASPLLPPRQVFSFKLRGAFNKMAKLEPAALARGVITSSAGNHAQGVALAASKLVRVGGAGGGRGRASASLGQQELAVRLLFVAGGFTRSVDPNQRAPSLPPPPPWPSPCHHPLRAVPPSSACRSTHLRSR
jgi:hypothetical protein